MLRTHSVITPTLNLEKEGLKKMVTGGSGQLVKGGGNQRFTPKSRLTRIKHKPTRSRNNNNNTPNTRSNKTKNDVAKILLLFSTANRVSYQKMTIIRM